MTFRQPETGADTDVQAAISAGDSSRLPPEMRDAVEQHGWEIARTLGCLGTTGSDVTNPGRAGVPIDAAGDFADK